MKDEIRQLSTAKKWHQWWPYFLIIGIWFLIVLTNYVPGSWLTGWDNLHPEWDPWYDLWRTFNGVWQEHQGLGLLGGMAHMSDLARQLFVLILSWILPKSLIRYTLLFAQLLIGSIGAYALFNELFTDQRQQLTAKLASLTAALFYLLNLGTVQNFYVAFEPFYWFYGMLPWLLLWLFRLWRGSHQRGWLIFILLSFLATPQAYIQTNFVVYCVLLTICGLCFLGARRPVIPWKSKFSRLLGSAAVVIGTNLFWLAPMIYFVFSGGTQTTIRSQINQMSTREVTVQNQAYENLSNILTLHGYWFAGQDYDTTDDQAAPIAFMQTWMSEPATAILAYIFAGLLVIGVIYLLVYRRDYRSFAVIFGFVGMCGLLLANHLESALIGQIFRSPFTKVIVPLSLLYSLLVGASVLFFARLLRPKFQLLFFGFFLIILGMYSVPTFGGHFIYHNLRPYMPDDYADLFAYMRTQPEAARTALLPAETVYGWQHMTWGYRGIGFYWFGLHQSILDRTFDVWSFDNEEFYQELHFARLAGDRQLFAQILAKYDVRYLIYDRGIHRRGRDSERFHQEWLDLLADQCPQIHSSELIQVYDCGELSDHYILAPTAYHVSNTSQFHQFYDPNLRLGTYVTGDSETAIDLPFAFLAAREPGAERFTYRDDDPSGLHHIMLEADLPNSQYTTLSVPSPLEATRASFLVSVDYLDEETYQVSIDPLFRLYVNGEQQEVFPSLHFHAPAIPGAHEVYFDFGSDYALLTPGEATKSAVISFTDFDHDQIWRYFAAGRARSRGININVSLQDTIELEVPTNFWDRLRKDQVISLKAPINSLQAEVISQPIYLRSFATNDAVNCDVIFRGSVDRQPDGEHGYAYKVSGHGSYCDTFYDSHLDQARHSFLVRVDARNLAGLPLTYYFWDINHQVQSWETLLPSGTIRQTFSFPRVDSSEPTAYFDVHTANRSLAGEEAYNILDQTVAYVAPTEQLLAVTLGTDHAQEQISNNLQLTNITKLGTSQYHVRAKITGNGPGLLVLTQGYHAGWQAKIGPTLLPHEKYEDWANAWMVDPSLCPDGECDIEISFWPQWLGWLGLAGSIALALTALSALAYHSYNHFRHHPQAQNLKKVLLGHRAE